MYSIDDLQSVEVIAVMDSGSGHYRYDNNLKFSLYVVNVTETDNETSLRVTDNGQTLEINYSEWSADNSSKLVPLFIAEEESYISTRLYISDEAAAMVEHVDKRTTNFTNQVRHNWSPGFHPEKYEQDLYEEL